MTCRLKALARSQVTDHAGKLDQGLPSPSCGALSGPFCGKGIYHLLFPWYKGRTLIRTRKPTYPVRVMKMWESLAGRLLVSEASMAWSSPRHTRKGTPPLPPT
jgi:hypothetical protein